MRLALVLFLLTARAWGAEGEARAPSPHAIDVPKWFAESFLDIREDVAEAARDGKRLLIYFGQDGCPYCKALMKAGFSDPAIAAKTRRHFVPVALNLWGDREVTWIDGRRLTEKALGATLNVQFTPTLLFFDEHATVVLRLNGYPPPRQLDLALDFVGGRVEARQSFTDYVAGRPAGEGGAALVAEPFFASGAPDLRRLLAAAGKPLLVLFERRFCSDCIELHREGFARPEVRALLDRFSVLQLDLLGERKVAVPSGGSPSEREWARRLRVVYTPTLVFLDREGREVFRAEGQLKPFHLASALDYVASGAYRAEPSFQRFVQRRAERLRASGQAVDLWN